MGYASSHIGMLAALAAVAAWTPAAAGKAELLAGPVQARVLEVLDGDTIIVVAVVWPGQFVHTSIRIRGIDAPEIRSRCAEEKAAALRARDALAQMIGAGAVSISNIGGAKYYGRVLADVATEEGEPVAAMLLQRALVRGYDGGKRESWCG